ncbi:hypothetical protein BES34_016455 [Leptospira inadai serovar Lyme]|uniref:Uncharacterized protein n=1 Tax=Leptospira inadai serovar Lyme TaxID=293084 RepID=A0ABX4YFJ6_9LEPT|nr:hypothetical protein BES34_016455 [Leptospira inadai serovar Lyme]
MVRVPPLHFVGDHSATGFAFRGQKTEDRRVRFARARQKLLYMGKVAEVEERSSITQESFSRTWKPCSPIFCLPSSAWELQHNSFLKKLLSG